MTKIMNMPNAEYHSHPALGSSNIKTLLKNPYEFLNPVKWDDKRFSIGSAVHKMILEPDEFNEEFAVAPEVNKKTKAGKEAWEAFCENADGKTVLDVNDYALCRSCTDAVMSHNEAKVFLSGGAAEQSFFSEIDGVQVKCRPDYYREDIGIIADVKTCQDASPDGFIRDVANFGYYIQAAFYMDVLRSLGLPANKFLFICVEKKEPFMVGLYELDIASLEFGRDEYMRAFSIYRNIDKFKTPIYRSTADESVVQTLTLPNYVYYRKGA